MRAHKYYQYLMTNKKNYTGGQASTEWSDNEEQIIHSYDDANAKLRKQR
jgi:hypothetical protein